MLCDQQADSQQITFQAGPHLLESGHEAEFKVRLEHTCCRCYLEEKLVPIELQKYIPTDKATPFEVDRQRQLRMSV